MEARKWEDILSFYNELVSKDWPLHEITPVINYIIRDNELNEKLFGCTSLDKLVISIYNPIDKHRESMHIQFDNTNQLWVFEYYPAPNYPVEHTRAYPGNMLLEKFKDYINELKW